MLARKYRFFWFYFSVLGFAGISTALFNDFPVILGIPIVLAIAYFAIFHLDYLFEFVVLATPLSINFENLSDFGGRLLYAHRTTIVGNNSFGSDSVACKRSN